MINLEDRAKAAFNALPEELRFVLEYESFKVGFAHGMKQGVDEAMKILKGEPQ